VFLYFFFICLCLGVCGFVCVFVFGWGGGGLGGGGHGGGGRGSRGGFKAKARSRHELARFRVSLAQGTLSTAEFEEDVFAHPTPTNLCAARGDGVPIRDSSAQGLPLTRADSSNPADSKNGGLDLGHPRRSPAYTKHIGRVRRAPKGARARWSSCRHTHQRRPDVDLK